MIKITLPKSQQDDDFENITEAWEGFEKDALKKCDEVLENIARNSFIFGALATIYIILKSIDQTQIAMLGTKSSIVEKLVDILIESVELSGLEVKA